jgi:predicted DNA-binding transcriptional regulator YafY
MANPTTNVLALLELLQNHELISGKELSRQLGIEPRTLRRYISSLESLGIPVVAERGCDGGYRLMNGYKLPPMMFTNEEAVALGIGLVAARSIGLATTPASNSALSKLERVMPENTKRRLKAVGSSVALDIANTQSLNDPEIIVTLSAATRNQQSVQLVYLSPQRTQTERQADPYGLAYFGGRWYLVAYCHLRKDIRTFRLDRIVSTKLIARSFGKPEDFDAIRFISTSFATIPRAHQIKILLRTPLASAHEGVFTAFGILEPQEGDTLLTVQADDLNWVARELSRLPFKFTIIEPSELTVALAGHISNLMNSVKSEI